MDLADLASKIEFSVLPDSDEGEAPFDEKEFDIVSPFATILSGVENETTIVEDPESEEPEEIPAELPEEEPLESGSSDEKKKSLTNPENSEISADKLNTNLESFTGNPGISVVYRPFLLEEYSDPEELEAMPEEDDITDDTVIEEREGVHYINKAILNSDHEEQLNEDFKNLVDSLID